MTEHQEPKIGRPSKGQRRSFTVRLDLERATKLAEILRILNIDGIAYLSPIIETHLAAIDLQQLRTPMEEAPTAEVEKSTNSISRSTVQRNHTREEALRRAQSLSGKINLLLDAIPDGSGQPHDYPAIKSGTEDAGYFFSRTRWSHRLRCEPGVPAR